MKIPPLPCILAIATMATAEMATASWDAPEASETVKVNQTMVIPAGKSVDFKFIRLVPSKKSLGDGSQKESQKPILILKKGASVRNLIIGAPGADGIHCRGDNLLENVWFEDVGEDAVTVLGANVRWNGGGARKAEDKVVQVNHKGPFYGENLQIDGFGTGFRSNGPAGQSNTIPYRIELRNIHASNGSKILVMSNPGATGVMSGIRAENVKHFFLAEFGAVITCNGCKRK